MSDAFLPAPLPSDDRRLKPDETESELDTERNLDTGDASASDAVTAAHAERVVTSFRIPSAGDHLTADELSAELDDDSGPPL